MRIGGVIFVLLLCVGAWCIPDFVYSPEYAQTKSTPDKWTPAQALDNLHCWPGSRYLPLEDLLPIEAPPARLQRVYAVFAKSNGTYPERNAAILHLLADRHPSVRAATLLMLQYDDTIEPVRKRVSELMHDRSPDVRMAAMFVGRGLAQVFRYGPDLSSSLDDKSLQVRMAACIVMYENNPSLALAFLCKNALDDDLATRFTALTVIGNIATGEHNLEPLKSYNLLRSVRLTPRQLARFPRFLRRERNAEIRKEAINDAQAYLDYDTARALCAALHDPNADTRGRLLCALSTQSLLSLPLQKYFQYITPFVNDSAPTNERASSKMRDLKTYEEYITVRDFALFALLIIDERRAFPYLIQGLKAPNCHTDLLLGRSLLSVAETIAHEKFASTDACLQWWDAHKHVLPSAKEPESGVINRSPRTAK